MVTMPESMREVNFGDHSFSAYLCQHGWNGDVVCLKEGTLAESNFVTPQGKVLAKVLYNNRESTRRIFIPAK